MMPDRKRSMRTVWVVTALAVLAGSASEAQHAPTRRKITETIDIAAPVDRVWEVVGNVEDSSWVENVVGTSEQGGDPATSTRTLTLANGRTIVEKGRSYDPERHRFAYSITDRDVRDLPAGDYSATITVEAAGENRSTVGWMAAFYRGHPNNDPPPELNDENSEKAVRAWVHASLKQLKAKLEKDRT